MKALLLTITSFLYFSCSNIKPNTVEDYAGDSYRVISYNVENLFDTYDEEFKFDDGLKIKFYNMKYLIKESTKHFMGNLTDL